MPVKSTLTAVMRARESVTGALDDIESGALAAAGAFETAGQAADAFGRNLDDVQDEAASAARELTDTAAGALEAAGAFSLAEGRADEFGDELSETTFEAGALAGVLSSMPAADALAGGYDTDVRADINNTSFMAARAAIESLPNSHTVEVAADVDRDSFSIPQLAGSTVPFAAGGLSAPSVSPDSQTVPLEAGGMDLPNLSALQFPATDGGDELLALGGAGHVAAEGLDAASESAIEASAASALAASEADDAGDGFLSMVPGGEAAASALDSVRSSAFGAVPGLAAAENAVDEYGDEVSEATAETAALQASMAGLGGSGLGTEVLGFHGSVASLATILPALISLLGGLVAPLGAIAVSGGAAGGALAAIAGAGLLSQGEALVGTYQEVDGELKRITSSAEGAKVVLGDLRDRAGDIFSQLQTAQTSQFFSGLTEGGLTILEDAVGLTNRLLGPLSEMSDRLGEVFAATEPEGFAELEATTRALLPTIERLAGGAMRALPDFLRWIRTEGLDTADALLSLAGSALDLGVELAEVGGVVWQTVGPALSWLFGVAASGVDIFTDLPKPIQQAAIAAAIAAPVLSALAGSAFLATVASSGLAAALGTLTLPISGTVAALAALVGVGVAVANHFGLIDDAASALAGTWNTLVGGIEWTANAFLNLYDMAKPILMLIPGVNMLVWLFDNWRAVVDVLGDALAFVVGKAQDLVKWLDNLSGFDEFVGKFIGKADDRGKNQARVDLGGMKVGQGGTAAQDARGGPGGPQGPQQPPGPGGYGGGGGMGGYGSGGGQAGGAAATTGSGGGTTIKNEVHYYEQNGDATSEVARERRVRNIVRQMNSETRRSGTGLN